MRLVLGLLLTGLLLGCGSQKTESPAQPAATETQPPPEPAAVSFADVLTVFTQNCGGCHGTDKPKAGYVAVNHAGLLGPGKDSRPNIIPGQPDSSLTYQLIRDGKMPPSGKLADNQIDIVRRWIAEGAKSE